jgi:hypothetical protein
MLEPTTMSPLASREYFARRIFRRDPSTQCSALCYSPDSWMRSLREALLEQMQSGGLGPSEVYVTQEHTRPFRAIERAVDDLRPQLLVIGTSRYAALKRLLSSSVTNEVLRKIECDVLIVSSAAAQHVRNTLGNSVRQDDSAKCGTAIAPTWTSRPEVVR